MPKQPELNLELTEENVCQTPEELLVSEHAQTVLNAFNERHGTELTIDEVAGDYPQAQEVIRYFTEEWVLSGRVKPLRQTIDLIDDTSAVIKAEHVDRELPLDEATERLDRSKKGFKFDDRLAVLDDFHTGGYEHVLDDWPKYMPPLTEGKMQEVERALRDGKVNDLFFDLGALEDTENMEEFLGEARARRLNIGRIFEEMRSFTPEQLKALSAERDLDALRTGIQDAYAEAPEVVDGAPAWIGFKHGSAGYETATKGVIFPADGSDGAKYPPRLPSLGQYLAMTDFLRFRKAYDEVDFHKDFLRYQLMGQGKKADAFPVGTKPIWSPLNHFDEEGRVLIVSGDRQSNLKLKKVPVTYDSRQIVLATRKLLFI